jgi:hypothetical protein
MHADDSELRRKIAEAQAQHAENIGVFEKVKDLLAKADERHRKEPAEARKWHHVLENLETSLDETRKRVELGKMELLRLERALEELRHGNTGTEGATDITSTSDGASDSRNILGEKSAAFSLEDASRLQKKIESGEIHDKHVEAGLELANQLGGATMRVILAKYPVVSWHCERPLTKSASSSLIPWIMTKLD